MKKNKIVFLVLLLTLIFFTLSLVPKIMQNDTFFYIPIGERIAQTHTIDGLDHWSFHENLRFTYPGWICNLTMYLLYNSFGFDGIYNFVLIMTALITIVYFSNLLKAKNGLLLSFIVAMIVMYLSKGIFTARNQIFSFLVFELEIYSLIGLLEYGKKRYFWILLVLAFLLVLVHDTLYIMFFVFIMPYLADLLLNRFFKIDNTHKFKNSNLKNGKYLIILTVLAIPIGFCTPVFASTYTNLINCMDGLSSTIINELMQPNIMGNAKILTIIFLAIGLFGFTKTKYKLKDVLFVFGLIIFALMANRNSQFLYLIGTIYLTNMLTECINNYVGEQRKNLFFGLFENSKYLVTLTCCSISIFGIYNFSYKLVDDYVSNIYFPVEATEWIKENVDYENARIWTHFDWGSYLELKGIKVFIDSRSGMYTEQENKDCHVLEDWFSVRSRRKL